MNCRFQKGLKAAIVLILTVVTLAAGLPAQEASGDIVEFTPERWDLADAKIVDHLDRKALMGTALLKDVEFEDGVDRMRHRHEGGSPILSRHSFQGPVSGGI